MKSIRYAVHFPALLVAMLLFWLAKDVAILGFVRSLPPGESLPLSEAIRSAIMGALYASTIVVSLTAPQEMSILRPVGFISLTVFWNALIPIIAWAGSVWLSISGLSKILLFVLITETLIGSAGLWLLVCWFRKKSLRLVDLFRTISLCGSIPVLLYIAFGAVSQPIRSRFWMEVLGMLITEGWRLGFSIGLYWSDQKNTAIQPMEISPEFR